MSSLLFHILVIPGVFLLGRLSRSVHISGFHIKKNKNIQTSTRGLQKL